MYFCSYVVQKIRHVQNYWTTTTPVFGTVSVPSTLTAAQAKTAPANPDVVVVGRGIQTDGLGTATTPTAIYALL